MNGTDLIAAMDGEPLFDEGDAKFWRVADYEGGLLWVGRWCRTSPWERHAAGDELLHVLEGVVELTVLTGEGPVSTTLRSGSVFVVPRGMWHRQSASAPVLQWGATPGVTEHSMADDPRGN